MILLVVLLLGCRSLLRDSLLMLISGSSTIQSTIEGLQTNCNSGVRSSYIVMDMDLRKKKCFVCEAIR